MWPTDPDELAKVQRTLAAQHAEPWTAPVGRPLRVVACWVCFPRGVTGPGAAGDPAWAAAVVTEDARVVERRTLAGRAAAPYRPGMLALRTGALLDEVVRPLTEHADVLLLDATGRDHPRRAGLALHLGAVLDLPSVGVTHRPLLAGGQWPEDEDGASAPLRIQAGPDNADDAEVGRWLRTRAGARPLAVHAGWRTDPATAVAVVRATTRGRRTPEPLRIARRLARESRAPG